MNLVSKAIIYLIIALVLLLWSVYSYYINSYSQIKSGPTTLLLILVITFLIKAYKEYKK